MNPVLQGIESAAIGIASERKRLNDTFEQLRVAVRTFDSTATLGEDGRIYTGDLIAEVAATVAPSAPPEPQAATVPPPAEEPQPEVPADRPLAEPLAGQILEYLRNVDVPVSHGTLATQFGVDDAMLKHVLNHMRDEQLVVRTTNTGLYHLPSKSKGNGKAKRTITMPDWSERETIVLSEQRKKRILDFLNENIDKDFVPQEIASALGITRHTQVSEDLRDLINRGVPIAVKENYRRPKGIETGRFSNAYVVVNEPARWIDLKGGERDPFNLQPSTKEAVGAHT